MKYRIIKSIEGECPGNQSEMFEVFSCAALGDITGKRALSIDE